MQRFDWQWKQVHEILPQLCYRCSALKPDDVLTEYERVAEFIASLSDYRLRHCPSVFQNVLAYAHFLAGLLAYNWIKTAFTKAPGYFPASSQDRLPRMTQAMLDHFAMANDLEARFASGYQKNRREGYMRAVLECALAEATGLAVWVKTQLPVGSAPFMQRDLITEHERYRNGALKRSKTMPVNGKDWSRVCAIELEGLGLSPASDRGDHDALPRFDDPVASDIAFQMNEARHRLFYLWSRAYQAYLEFEAFEYGKASMAQPNGHFPEIMPPLPGSVWITNTVIAGEWEHLEDEARRGWFKEGFTSRNCLFGSDGRLHTGASFNAPELSLSGLFKRVMVHVRAAHESGQAAYSRDLAEAALAQLEQLEISKKNKRFLNVNVTAMLARAVAALPETEQSHPKAAARGVLSRITPEELKSLPLRDRWYFHYIASFLEGGAHKSLATRGRKLAQNTIPPKPRSLISEARFLMHMWAGEVV